MILLSTLKTLISFKAIHANKNAMTEVKTFVNTEIIHGDTIGCTEEFVLFSKQLLQSQFNVEYDHVTFRCYTKIDDKGVRHTKRYKEVKIPIQ